MSQEDTMRLVAEVVDKYSGPLKQMNESLKKLGQQLKQTHDDGKKHTSEHAKVFAQFRDQLINFKSRGIDVAKPALEGLNVAAFATSGAISAAGAAVTKATMDWASYGQQLSMAQRSSGLTIDSLRGLADANQRFGISQEETIASLERFGEHMNELHRRSPAYINAWKAMGANAWSEIGSKLMRLDGDREAQLKKAMELIPTIRDTDQRRRVLALLGLPENWATLAQEDLQNILRWKAEFAKQHPMDVERANKAKMAWESLRSTLRGLWSDIGNNVGVAMFDGFKWIADHEPNFKSVENAFKGMAGSAFSFSSDLKDFESIGNIFKSMADSSSTLKSDLQDVQAIGHGLKDAWNWLGDTFKNILSGKTTLGDHETAFAEQHGPDKESQEKTQESIKKGVIEGMTDFWNFLKNVQQASPQGYTPMAFHPNGGGGMGRSWRFGNSQYPDMGGGGTVPRSMGKSTDGSSVPLDATGMPASGSLAEQRQRFARELQNTALRDKVLRIAANEQGSNAAGTQGIIESMMNRASVRGTSLAAQARWHESEGGYYQQGTMGRGALENPRSRAILENSLANALRGTDIVNGATDNSSQGLAARERASGTFRFLKEINRESFFAPGTAESRLARRWDQWQAGTHGASLRDMARHGTRGHHGDAELLRRGMRTVDMNGNAKVDITLNGFPRGTRTRQNADGIFKQVTLNRGRPMSVASETS